MNTFFNEKLNYFIKQIFASNSKYIYVFVQHKQKPKINLTKMDVFYEELLFAKASPITEDKYCTNATVLWANATRRFQYCPSGWLQDVEIGKISWLSAKCIFAWQGTKDTRFSTLAVNKLHRQMLIFIFMGNFSWRCHESPRRKPTWMSIV